MRTSLLNFPHIPKIEHVHHDVINSSTILEPTNFNVNSSFDDHAYLPRDNNVNDADKLINLHVFAMRI